MKHYDYMTGYKATDKDMQCHGDGSVNFQFEIGKWYKHEGEIELCKKGFHFCKYQSGPWAYYTDSGTRIFKVEAKGVVEEYIPGADLKFVCREIRLTEEIKRTGDCNAGNGNAGNGNTGNRNAGNGNTGNRNAGNGNTGDRNAGDCNAGNRNTGNRNAGDCNTGNRNAGNGNTGDRNTGDCNTGNRNAGNRNTGNRNAGDCNTGNRNTGNGNTGNRNAGNGNTGDCNTGNRNAGNRNTGNRNTGNGNTGDCNTGDGNTGFFCQREPLVISFDKQTKLTRQEFFKQYPEIYKLGELLFQDREFDYTQFKRIPGWTLKKCKELHRKHIEGRTQAHK